MKSHIHEEGRGHSPYKVANFFFGVRIASVGIDPNHDIDFMPCHFDTLDEGADEIPWARPVGRF